MQKKGQIEVGLKLIIGIVIAILIFIAAFIVIQNIGGSVTIKN